MKTILWISVLVLMVISASAKSLYKIEGNIVIVDLEGIGVKSRVLKVEVWSDKTVKIISGMDVELAAFQSYMPQTLPLPVKFKVGYSQNNIEITTRDLIVSVQEDGLVRIFNREGNKLVIESDRSFEPTNSNEAKFKIKQKYFLNVHEDIYGFGFDGSAPRYAIRNSNFVMKQTPSMIASPVMFSEKGYAIIWDNYSQTTFKDKKGGLDISSDFADEIQYFFIYGPSWDEIIAEIRRLTGKAPMLPRWAYAHWSFPDFYNTIETQQSKIASYNERGLPSETNINTNISFFKEEKTIIGMGIKERLSSLPAYPLMKEKYSEHLKTSIENRPCIPTFTNYPGIQAFSTFLVAGEVGPTWESLKNQVIAGINLPLSGQPYWSTIIGGTNQSETGQGTDNELLTRWYQFATFTPVFVLPRPDRDFFTVSSVPFSNAIAKTIKLRYHLLPYIYSTAAEVSSSNKTFTRSLLFDFQKTEKVHSIDQQYMFGESMMICPVTKPSATELHVFFPPGNGWYDFYSGKHYPADTNQIVDAPIENIPVFVKSGSIIPFGEVGLNSADSLGSPIEIRIYPGNDAKFTLYEDAGDGYGYQSGQFAKITFNYSEKDKTVSVGAVEGSYIGMIVDRIFRFVIVTESTGIGTNFSDTFKEVAYKGKRVKVKL
jgi:alpha-glucosidase (family GH31 glycosyl hydrolase)